MKGSEKTAASALREDEERARIRQKWLESVARERARFTPEEKLETARRDLAQVCRLLDEIEDNEKTRRFYRALQSRRRALKESVEVMEEGVDRGVPAQEWDQPR